MDRPINVLGGKLTICGTDPVTGYYRDGVCNTCKEDFGSHTVCVEVTKEFLDYSKSQGNDLSTPMPMYGFPGLYPGDSWCLCASRWLEAEKSGMAPNFSYFCLKAGTVPNIFYTFWFEKLFHS